MKTHTYAKGYEDAQKDCMKSLDKQLNKYISEIRKENADLKNTIKKIKELCEETLRNGK